MRASSAGKHPQGVQSLPLGDDTDKVTTLLSGDDACDECRTLWVSWVEFSKVGSRHGLPPGYAACQMFQSDLYLGVLKTLKPQVRHLVLPKKSVPVSLRGDVDTTNLAGRQLTKKSGVKVFQKGVGRPSTKSKFLPLCLKGLAQLEGSSAHVMEETKEVEECSEEEQEAKMDAGGVMEDLLMFGSLPSSGGELVSISKDVLKRILDPELASKVLDTLKHKKLKAMDDELFGDVAYLLRKAVTAEVMEPGDVVFVIYEMDQLVCTKERPKDHTRIFGHSVVAGMNGLVPYIVARPYGRMTDAMPVVYFGHANVKVRSSSLSHGDWLYCESEGYASASGVEGEELGRVIGRCETVSGISYVPAFVFLGKNGSKSAEVAQIHARLDSLEAEVTRLKEESVLGSSCVIGGNIESEGDFVVNMETQSRGAIMVAEDLVAGGSVRLETRKAEQGEGSSISVGKSVNAGQDVHLAVGPGHNKFEAQGNVLSKKGNVIIDTSKK